MVEYIKNCKYCSKEFVTLNSRKQYCHQNCRAAAHRDKRRNNYEKKCPICGKSFISSRSLNKYCSRECYEVSKVNYRNEHKIILKKEPIKKVCPVCGKEFLTTLERSIYCSKSCKNRSRRVLNPEKERNRVKIYYEKNKQKYKEWEEKNKEKRKIQKRAYYFAHKEEKRAYAQANKEHIKQVKKRRRELRLKEDPNYKMTLLCKRMVRRCLTQKKTCRTQEILNYKPEEIRNHIETQFYKDMSWDNQDKWEIHHIIPLGEFNFVNSDGTNNYATIRKANALNNLIPLLKEDHKVLTNLYNQEHKFLSKKEIIERFINE